MAKYSEFKMFTPDWKNIKESDFYKFWKNQGWISEQNMEKLTGVEELVEGRDYEVVSSTLKQ